MSIKFENLPKFIQIRLNKLKEYQGKPLEHPLTEPIDIWSLDAKRLFPDSPSLQKDFNEIKKQELSKRKNL
jgi:hypothetical protein